MQQSVPFIVLQSFTGEERVVCFTFCVLLMYCLFLTVLWVGMQCTIVAFPGHSHLLFSIDLAKEEREKDCLVY